MLRRLLAVFLALVVGVSVSVVSVVVAGSSVGAVNTASEALFDHDDEPATGAVRQFAGADRYATSVRLAEQFVSVVSGTRSVIVASGDSVVDAAAAAGLAAVKEAPVVLTPSSRLFRGVEDFIVEEFISEVYIVGGTAAVSQAVEDALGALAPVSSVTRLAGADRYATSVLVSEEMGESDPYCDSELTTALLVNVDSSFADVIAIGPLAYAARLPLLLTSADALPADVASYLGDQGVEQVIVVGGVAAVSQAVREQVSDAGVDTIRRISGETRFATALAIREELANCSSISLSPTTVALVNGEAAADGVAAGPVLGNGLADDGVTPVLLVSTGSLPPETSGYLAGTAVRNIDTTFANLSLTAIGGTAVVTEAVMAAAVAAAVTSGLLTATIAAKAGATTATITFSDPVSGAADGTTAAEKAAFASSAENKANYLVGGAPLLSDDTLTLGGSVLTITFGNNAAGTLIVGQEISVLGNKIKGAGADNRLVQAAEFTVPDLVVDKVRPRVQIHAAQGGHSIRLSIIEDNLVEAVGRLSFPAGDSRLSANNQEPSEQALLGAITITDSAGTVHPLHTSGSYHSSVLYSSTSKNIHICLFGVSDLGGSVTQPDVVNTCTSTPGTPTAAAGDTRPRTAFATGDSITVAADAFADTAGNLSSSTSVVVDAYQAYPRVIRASVTAPALYDPTPLVPGGEALATWQWARYVADDTNLPADADSDLDLENNYLSITGKADGVAAGAAGNAWHVAWTALPDDENDIPVVKVNVYESRKTINVEFDDDAKVFNAVIALNENDFVTSNFSVTSDAFSVPAVATRDIAFEDEAANSARLDPCPSAAVGVCGAPSELVRWDLAGGQSAVMLKLNFSEYIRYFNGENLRVANSTDPNFPTGADNWILSFTPAGQVGSRADIITEATFTLLTTDSDLENLPKPGETISLVADMLRTYSPTDCTGFVQIGTSDCGRNIAVSEQRLRASN